jgi:hypothetical protein
MRCAIVERNLPINSDGISYLDVARAYLRHDWSTAVNGYWGPLYSWLLAVVLKVAHPQGLHEFAALRTLNLLIFIFCMYAFGRFWRAATDWNRKRARDGVQLADVSPFGWLLLEYLLFLTMTAWDIGLATPDLLVAGIVLLIAAQLFELDDSQPHSIMRYMWLGLLVGAGFYAKAILFYFGLFVLLALFIRAFGSRNYRGPLTASLVCLLLVSPFVIALSRTLGHFSVGESGRLNYAWFVDGTETGSWEAGSASFPFFPGPVVLNSPRVFRVPRLEGVTYAPWYDAARFDKRSRATFRFRSQVRQFVINLKNLEAEILGLQSALFVCLVILICFAPKAFRVAFAGAWFCTLPVVMVIAMYLLVHLVDRFTIGFLLVLWGVAYACIRIPANLQFLAQRALLATVAVFGLYAIPGLLLHVASSSTNPLRRDVLVAEALPNHGLVRGDSVGLIGNGQEAYWAHWTGVSIVAEVASMDSDAFWSSLLGSQRNVVRAMEESGAKAVIWRRDSNRRCPPEWIDLPEQSGCLISLQPQSHPAP